MNAKSGFRVVDGGRPSITRPEDMFDCSEDNPRKPLRDKLLFNEAMVASAELNLTELRVGFLLINMWSPTRGCSYPSMQYIAGALSMDKRQMARALNGLEAKGWFLIRHGTRGRGAKNHANRYVPNVEKVTSATPFKDAALRSEQRRAEQEKVTLVTVKGDSGGTEKVTLQSPNTSLTESGVKTDTFRASHGPAAGAAGRCDLANSVSKDDLGFADRRKAIGKLQQIQRDWLPYLRAQPDKPLTAHERRIIEQALQDCDEIAEMHDSHTGDSISGMAYRLAEELSYYLPQDEADEPQPSPAPEPEPEESFEDRKARMIREIEAWSE